jgi:hydrogenase expression/formation protein HypE
VNDDREGTVSVALEGAVCPIPLTEYPQVVMAHGGGGKLMHHLIERLFGAAFGNPLLDARHDGAVFPVPPSAAIAPRIAFTTDSYVVRPLFFPGGNIGTLAVNGTVNDLAMCGATPAYLSSGFILEEGLPMEALWRVVRSMRLSADAAGVSIVTGDTKVVDRGKGDGLYVNTAGVGYIRHALTIGPASVRPGDAIIVSGDIARHGMAIMAVREGLEFESRIESDCAPLAAPITALIDAGVEVHCLRDLTRGGLASALVEIAEASRLHLHVLDRAIGVREDVRAACELLGFDPMYVANEGRFVCFVPQADAEHTIEVLRRHPVSADAAVVGTVSDDDEDLVTLESAIGATRVVDMLSGEQLPRIC